MDWLNPEINVDVTVLSEDMFHDSLQFCKDHINVNENSPLDHIVTLVEPELNDIQSSGLFTFDDDNPVTDNRNMDDIGNGISSNECSYQHSTFASDLSGLSPIDLNESETDWFMPESPSLPKTSFKFVNAQDENSNGTSSRTVYDGSRRSYSLGNSNSKNAIAARDNRLKKKKYIASLEESVRNLRAENERLQDRSEKANNAVNVLQNEVSYLKRVIANQSALAAVLKNVLKTPGIRLTTSFTAGQNVDNSEVDRANERMPPCGFLSDDAEDESSSPKTKCTRQNKQNISDSFTNTKSSIVTRKNLKRTASACQELIPRKLKKKNDNVDEAAFVDIEILDTSTSSISIDEMNGGICLHVAGQNVSLEFCSSCSRNAKFGMTSDHSYVKQ